MKIRHPFLLKTAGLLGAGVLKLWMSTVRSRIDTLGQQTDPSDPHLKERFIYVIWHDTLMCVNAVRPAIPVSALISQSSDGELLSNCCRAFGLKTIRGSSSRGGIEAAEELIEASCHSHLLIAPDGPRGPRREVKRGLAYLASWTGLRVVPVGAAFSRAWRAKSWDRTALPKPFSTMYMVAGPILCVPQGLGKAAMEGQRQLIEETLQTATSVAEAWAAGSIAKPAWPTARAAA